MSVRFRILKLKRTTAFLVAVGPWSGIMACGVFAFTDGALAVATPGYDAVGETTSQLMSEDARYSELARTGLAVYCVLLVPFVMRVTSLFRAQQPFSLVRSGALWVHILASIAAASFQNDSTSAIFSGLTVNSVHDRSAEVLFAAAFLAIVATAVVARELESRTIACTSAIVAFVMALTGLGIVFAVLPDFTGIEERVGLVAYLIWVVVISRHALRSRHSRAHSFRG